MVLKKLQYKTGTTIHTIEGIKTYWNNIGTVTLSAIQSIVVVTSPIGDHAPPAFAAITIKPANHNLKFLSFMIF